MFIAASCWWLSAERLDEDGRSVTFTAVATAAQSPRLGGGYELLPIQLDAVLMMMLGWLVSMSTVNNTAWHCVIDLLAFN